MKEAVRFEDSQMESLHPQVTFTRRGFIASAVAAGFAVSAGPLAAQQAIKTPADGLDTSDAKIETDDGWLPAYVAAPKAAGKRPVVIVVPEVWGLHEYQKDICRRLAKAGYYAVSFDPYFRMGELWQYTDIKEVVAAANSLRDDRAFKDMDALVAWIEKQRKANGAKIGLTGMCRGGRTVWMYTARSKKIKAAVAWYGGLAPTPPAMPQTPMDVADQLNAPVLGLYGGADSGIPLDQVERMRAAIRAFEKPSIIHVYDDTPHAFHADYRSSYRKEAAEDGWKRMLAWFKKNGVA